MRRFIVLTGGPGGGKSTLIESLAHDPVWAGRFSALPEAIFLMRRVSISPREKLFQRVLVHLQMALEDGLDRALGPDDPRTILCHRGSLDPLAYWIDRGWPEEVFFTYTETTQEEHYRRYTAVIHLVTAADGAQEHYARWPDAHRPEQIEDAIRLDGLLQRVWRDHPCYHRIDNVGQSWQGKAEKARSILSSLLPVNGTTVVGDDKTQLLTKDNAVIFPRESGHDNKPRSCMIPLSEDYDEKDQKELHT